MQYFFPKATALVKVRPFFRTHIMEGNQNQHKTALEVLCRVCGGKLVPAKRRRSVYLCNDHANDLLTTFSIDVRDDSPSIHPVHFCSSCKCALYNAKQKGVTLLAVCEWEPHREYACVTCERAVAVQKKGRRSKENIGRPSATSRRALLSQVLRSAPASHHPQH